MFSVVMFPPQVPQPRVTVLGIPLKKLPPLAGAWGWRIMMRLERISLPSRSM